MERTDSVAASGWSQHPLLVWGQRSVTSSVHAHMRATALVHTLGMQIPRSSVHPGVIQMCLHSNFPPSRRTHMRLRSDDRKNSTMNFNCRCLTQNSHVLRLLADFVYHPVCGWSESSVGGKEAYLNFKNASDETNIICFSLQCIFYDVKWNIIILNNVFCGIPFGVGEKRHHSHCHGVL